jgi:hypothetical protein
VSALPVVPIHDHFTGVWPVDGALIGQLAAASTGTHDQPAAPVLDPRVQRRPPLHPTWLTSRKCCAWPPSQDATNTSGISILQKRFARDLRGSLPQKVQQLELRRRGQFVKDRA